MHHNIFVRPFYALMSFFVAFAVVIAFGGVGQAQAATVADPWLRTGGVALSDEFSTIMAHGGLQPVTAVSSSGTASVLLGGAGAGLAVGTKGLQLYSKVTTGSWDTYTEGLACGTGVKGKIFAGLGKAFKLMSFGLGGYTCATAPNTLDSDKLKTVDLSNTSLEKQPVPYHSHGWTFGNLKYAGWYAGYGSFHFDIMSPAAIGTDVIMQGVPLGTHQLREGVAIDDVKTHLSYLMTFKDGHQDIVLYLVTLDGKDVDTVRTPGLISISAGHGEPISMSRCTSSTAYIYSKILPGGIFPSPVSLCNAGKDVSVDTSGATQKRDVSCRVTAVDGSHVDVAGGSYTDAKGLPLDSGRWGCNQAWQQTISAGKVPARVTATSTFPGAVGDPKVLLNQPVTKEAQQSVTQAPECMDASSNSAGCVQRLYKRVGGQIRSCADADVWEQCADWLEETKAHPNDKEYECRMGTKVVDLKKCAMYSPTFKYPRADTKLHYATDTDTDTSIDTEGATSAKPDSKNCWAGMISWNPLDWVLTPIKCATVWAFVPSNTSTWQDVGQAWDGTPPVVVAKTLSGGIPLPEAGNGCSGPLVDLKSVGGKYLSYSGYPLSACEAPMSTLAARARMLASVMMYATTLWMVVRNITAAVNVPPPPAAI